MSESFATEIHALCELKVREYEKKYGPYTAENFTRLVELEEKLFAQRLFAAFPELKRVS